MRVIGYWLDPPLSIALPISVLQKETMNIQVTFRKENIDNVNTETGEWTKVSGMYWVFARIEYFDSSWNMTGWSPHLSKNVPQMFGELQMFPNQWDQLKYILDRGVKGTTNEIRYVEEEQDV